MGVQMGVQMEVQKGFQKGVQKGSRWGSKRGSSRGSRLRGPRFVPCEKPSLYNQFSITLQNKKLITKTCFSRDFKQGMGLFLDQDR